MKLIVFAVGLLICIVFPVFSDEHQIIIEKINYKVDGKTQEQALRRLSWIEEGQAFDSPDALLEALEQEVQDLENTRNFDSVSFEYSLISGNRYQATFYITDAWTIIPIPYPAYDSNTGLRLGLKTYWNNFLGTMTDAYLGMNMDIRRGENDRPEVGQWMINPKISGIRISDDLKLSLGLKQSHIETDFIDKIDSDNSYDYDYYQTSFSAGTNFALRRRLGYSLSTGMDFRYSYHGNLGPEQKQPAAFTLSQSLGWGKVDWLENRRDGYSLGISNPHRFGVTNTDLADGANDLFYVTSLNLSASYYKPLLKRFYYYSRFSTFYQYGEDRRTASALRGVADNLMSGVTGFTINNSLAFQFWRFENVWDAQIHPFFDIGLVYNGEAFNFERDFNIGAGFDLVLYIDPIPNLVARGTIGFDVQRFSMDNPFSGMEFMIESSLFY